MASITLQEVWMRTIWVMTSILSTMKYKIQHTMWRLEHRTSTSFVWYWVCPLLLWPLLFLSHNSLCRCSSCKAWNHSTRKKESVFTFWSEKNCSLLQNYSVHEMHEFFSIFRDFTPRLTSHIFNFPFQLSLTILGFRLWFFLCTYAIWVPTQASSYKYLNSIWTWTWAIFSYIYPIDT